MKNILIVEDNLITLGKLSESIYKEIGGEIKVYEAATVEDAYVILLANRIDVFIIDIILNTQISGDISGVKLANKIRKNNEYLFTPIIFITALADPKLYAYRELHSFGYLEKPFLMDEAIRLIRLALRSPVPVDEEKLIYFRKDGILYAVQINKVIYIQVRNHIMEIYMIDDKLKIPYITIKQFLKEVDARLFLQCNRSTLVNKKYIKYIDLSNRCVGLQKFSNTIDIGPTFYKKVVKELQSNEAC